MKKNFLLMLLVLLFITACTNEGKEVVPEFESTDMSVLDFEGKKYLMAQDKIGGKEGIFLYEQDSLYSDMLLEHIANFEKQYNFKLEYTTALGVGSEIQENLYTNLLSGTRICDFIFFGSNNANGRSAHAGTLYPLNYLDGIIDLTATDKYGPLNLLECSMAKGNFYGVIPNYWPLKANDGNMATLFFINEDLIYQYNLTDPRDLFEQNEWKLSKFAELTPQYHIQDGERDIKTFIGNSQKIAKGLASAYKLTPIYEINGEFLPATSDPDMIEAIEWGRNYSSTYASDYTYVTHHEEWKNLVNEECTLALGETMNIDSLAKEMNNFGIVPFPVADQYDSKDFGMAFTTITTMSIFAGVDDPEACGRIIDILFEEIEGFKTEDMAESLFKTIFFDKRDADLYVSLHKNAIYDYAAIGGTSLYSGMNDFEKKTGQQIVESLDGTMDQKMEEYLIPNYKAIQEYNK